MSIDFHNLSHEGIKNLIPYKPGKSIEELAREQGINDIIKMASNENPLGCSPLAYKALQSLSKHKVAMYPAPLNHPLLPKLANKHKLQSEQIFLSNGSDPIFGLLLNAFALHSPKHILVHQYSFSTYAIQAHMLNIPVRSVPTSSAWQVDIEAIIQACKPDTGLIYIPNPNNPTGILIDQNKIKHLLEQIPESTIVVLDEAYHEFAAPQQQVDSVDWLTEHSNLVITRTFSKIYGMAGLRIGYAMANKDIISILWRIQLPFTVNQLSLEAALAALDDDEFIDQSLKINRLGMQQMREGFNKLGLEFIPSACNFLTFDCKEDSLNLYNFLLKKGIIVRPLHPYKMNNFIRVSIRHPRTKYALFRCFKRLLPLTYRC